MPLFLSRARRARRTILDLLIPCLRPVQDDISNVPVAMQQDPCLNGALLGLVDAVCAALSVAPAKVPHVAAAVFEIVYRREATAVLTRCDQWEAGGDAAFAQGRGAGRSCAEGAPSARWTEFLRTRIDQNYERPDTLAL